jgi:hypothetical protein
MDVLARTVTDIERGDTLDDITSAVRAFATPHGYDRFVLYSSQPSRDRVLDTLYWVEGDWFGDGQAIDAETYRVVRIPHGTGLHGLQVPTAAHRALVWLV